MKKIIKLFLICMLLFVSRVYAEEWTCKYSFKDFNDSNYNYILEFKYNNGVVNNQFSIYREDGKNKYSGSGPAKLTTIGGNGGLMIGSNLTVTNINKLPKAYESGCPDNNEFNAYLSGDDGGSWYSSPYSQNPNFVPKAYTMINIANSGNNSVIKKDFHSNSPVTGTSCGGSTYGNCPNGLECVLKDNKYSCEQKSDYTEVCPVVTYKPDKTKHNINIESVDIIYRKYKSDGKFHPQIVSINPSTTYDLGSVQYSDNNTFWLATFEKLNVASGENPKKSIQLPYYTKCEDVNPEDFKTYDTTGSTDPSKAVLDYQVEKPKTEFSSSTRSCRQILGPGLTAVVHAGIRAVQIIGAIIAIVKGMMILIPAIIAKDADGLKKASKTLVSMAIILVIIFLVPGLLRFLGKIAGFDISCLV